MMYFPVKSADREIKFIVGSFAPNGSSAIDATKNQGHGFTVTKIDVGTYRITLSKAYTRFISATVTLQLKTAANCMINLGAVDVTAKQVDLRAVQSSDGVTAVEIAGDAANRIHFILALKETSIAN